MKVTRTKIKCDVYTQFSYVTEEVECSAQCEVQLVVKAGFDH